MKTNKLCLIGTASLLSLSLAVPSIFAEGPANSQATINFTNANDAPPVFDPEEPESVFDDLDPLNPPDDPTGQTGPLTLDYVSSIDFGNQEIALETMTYQAVTPRPFIQVTDRRGAGGLGWEVTASATPFTAGDQSNALNGAVLSFTNGEVTAGGTNNFTAPIAQSTIEIPTDGTVSANVVSAAPSTGLGAWLVRWFDGDTETEGNSNVTLEVPGGTSTEANFTSTITWTLSATPSSNN